MTQNRGAQLGDFTPGDLPGPCALRMLVVGPRRALAKGVCRARPLGAYLFELPRRLSHFPGEGSPSVRRGREGQLSLVLWIGVNWQVDRKFFSPLFLLRI